MSPMPTAERMTADEYVARPLPGLSVALGAVFG